MANRSGSKAGKGRGVQDAIDSLHTDTFWTDREKRALQTLMADAYVLCGSNPDRTYTFTYNLLVGDNPSLSFSVTT
jgi:hypothetical protein